MTFLPRLLAAPAIAAILLAVTSGAGRTHAASIYSNGIVGNTPPQPPVAATLPSYVTPACSAKYSPAFLATVATSALQIYHSQKVLVTAQQLFNDHQANVADCAVLYYDNSNVNLAP